MNLKNHCITNYFPINTYILCLLELAKDNIYENVYCFYFVDCTNLWVFGAKEARQIFNEIVMLDSVGPLKYFLIGDG